MTKKQLNHQGWTILEMMLAGSVFMIVSGGVVTFLNQQSDFWEYSTTQTDVRADVERALQNMSMELRLARRVTPGAAPNITIPASPNNTAVTFYVPTDVDGLTGVLNSLGDVEWNEANPIQFTYDAASRQLRRIEGGATRILGTDITAATFRDITMDNTLLSNEVRINVTMQRTTPHQRIVTASGATVVKLRN